MLTTFRSDKLIQAAAVLLKTTDPSRMSRLRLLKLLYIADRESLRETGQPITGDSVVAMDHGPVLKQTYNCIMDRDYHAHNWQRFFRNSGQHDVELLADPGVGKLSPYEVEKLEKVAEQFAGMGEWEVADHTHEFEEWLKHKPEPGSSKPIPIRDVLAAVGLEEYADEIIEEAKDYRNAEKLLRQPLKR